MNEYSIKFIENLAFDQIKKLSIATLRKGVL
jgi:hypothetical protein